MGKASSAKKVARAARAGGSRRPGQRRQLGFPVLIALIVVTGVSLILFARDSRDATAAPRSQANANSDHWHASLGIYQCDHFIFDGTEAGGPNLSDALEDPYGIHTHEDGVIHIHPFTDASGGRNARMRLFFDDTAIVATNDKITFPDGTVWDESETRCGEGDAAQAGEIVLARWRSAEDAANGERPSELITEDFGDTRFRADREYFTLAFLPPDQLDSIPVRPDVVQSLSNLSDLGGSTTTTVPPAGGSTTTTAPGADASTTTAPPADASATTTTVASG